jgi:hypothetical protein
MFFQKVYPELRQKQKEREPALVSILVGMEADTAGKWADKVGRKKKKREIERDGVRDEVCDGCVM